MIHKKRFLTAIQLVFLATFAAATCAYPQTPAKESAKAPAKQQQPAKLVQAVKGAQAIEAYSEFDKRLKDYEATQVKAEASLPKLGTKASAEDITEHKVALAQKLREARVNAKQGDIFTPAVSKRIRALFRVEFKGRARDSKLVRNSLREAEQLKDIRWRVGMAYPEKLPLETMPAGLLSKLPELPKDVQYRIVGHDLVLLDTAANVVIDFIPEAKP